jgi:hypothetical protein
MTDRHRVISGYGRYPWTGVEAEAGEGRTPGAHVHRSPLREGLHDHRHVPETDRSRAAEPQGRERTDATPFEIRGIAGLREP